MLTRRAAGCQISGLRTVTFSLVTIRYYRPLFMPVPFSNDRSATQQN